MNDPNGWILAILGAVVMIPLVLLLFYGHAERAWEHEERLKAMERNAPISERSPTRPLWQGLLVGVGVPLLVCFVVTLMGSHEEFWNFVSAIALLSSVPSVLVALRLPASAGRASRSTQLAGKPAFNPEAYDAVVQHG